MRSGFVAGVMGDLLEVGSLTQRSSILAVAGGVAERDLFSELGFEDGTPEEFSEAIEEGADVPPLALQQTLDLIDSGDVRLLAYNEQTESPETQRVRESAESAGIPVVTFVETLPEGETYVSWMQANVAAMADALTE